MSIECDDEEIKAIAHGIPHATNNQAEYYGAYLGITEAIALGATHIRLYMDSQLVIRQLSGEYKIKNESLKTCYNNIAKALSTWGGTIEYTHVRREQNKRADALSNIAMDEVAKRSL